MRGVEFENTEVEGYCEIAKIVGYLYESGASLTVDNNCELDNIKVSSIVQTISASDFTLADGATLKGASDNTFWVYNSTKMLLAAATNDWAWYSGFDTSPNATYNGNSIKQVSRYICSASANFTNGKPVED